jgi:hypothetical protein
MQSTDVAKAFCPYCALEVTVDQEAKDQASVAKVNGQWELVHRSCQELRSREALAA